MYKPFPNGWLMIVLAPLCCLVKSLFLTVQSPCEPRFEAVSYPSTSNCSSLYTCVEPRGTPWVTLHNPLRDSWKGGLMVDGQWLPRRLFVSVVINCFDWDLYVPLCTQSIPIWEYYVFCPQPSSTWGVCPHPFETWMDMLMLGFVSPQPSQKVLPYSA